MSTTAADYDIVGGIMAFESRDMNREQIVELFQHLVDSGTIYGLQGSYQRLASELIASGEITAGGEK